MRALLFVCCLLWAQGAFAQTGYDVNWCFAQGAGMHFNANGTVDTFSCKLENFEANASISDRQGNLLFFIDVPLSNSLWGNLQAAQGINLINGDSLLLAGTATSGGVFLPGLDDNTFHYYHLGYSPDSAVGGNNSSLALYSTTIIRDVGTSWQVVNKNTRLVTGSLEEKLAVTKSADGTCWWLVTHRFSSAWCNDLFIALQVCNGTVTDSLTFNVGKPHCYSEGIAGEMAFSPDGHILAQTVYNDSVVELYDFDRCTGDITLNRTIDVYNRGKLYGLAFSATGDALYITESPGGFDTSYLYQYYIPDSTLTILHTFTQRNETIAQLELGPNGKIYLAHCGAGCNPGVTINTTQCLGVIHSPDVKGNACDFRPYDLCFSDSVKMAFGLPNYPNYDQGLDGVYGISAGRDTSMCMDIDFSVQIGNPPLPNIVYRWQADSTLSDTSVSQPIVSPTEDTWYYLTMTDTTHPDCAVSTDSVFVDMLLCSGVEEQRETDFLLYPNPANSKVQLALGASLNGATFNLYNMLGKQVLQEQLDGQTEVVDVSGLSQGVYLYQLVAGEKTHTGKLLVE